MVSEKVSVSRQVLVSQTSISLSSRKTQYLAAIIATLGGFIGGTCLAWTSPTANALVKNQVYGFPVSKEEIGWIGSFMALGAMLGAIITAVFVDRLGRKNLILALVIPIVIGWAIMAFATSVVMFCVGRFLTGIATGSYCVVIPIYTTELAEKDIRGTLGTYFQLQITIGILFVYVIGVFVSVFTLTVICGLIPLLYTVLMFLIPEAPYFHLMKRDMTAAQESLSWFRGDNYDGRMELEIMQKTIEDDENDKVPFFQAFQTTAAKRGLIIGLGVMFLQQFSGCNAVIFYTNTIFKEAAGDSMNENVSTIIVGVLQVIATWVASMVVDKLGRRILLLLSISIMTLSTFTLGLYFYLKEVAHVNVTNIALLPLISISAFIIIFSLGFGPIPWMLMAEIFPSKIRGAASSLACLVNWLCVFIVTMTFPWLTHVIGGSYTFWCFTVCSGFGILFVMFVVPETKGKSLAEVQEILGGGERSMSRMPTNLYSVNEEPFEEPKVKM